MQWLLHWPLMGELLHSVQRGGTGRATAPPSPLLTVPNATAHPSTASVPTSYYLMWHYNCLWTTKGWRVNHRLQLGSAATALPRGSRQNEVRSLDVIRAYLTSTVGTRKLAVLLSCGGCGITGDWNVIATYRPRRALSRHESPAEIDNRPDCV